MIIFLSILWFIRTTKALLFWIYLWQLKDYHIGRFIDHFRTAKGKTLFLNPLFFVKIILFLISLSLPWQDYGDGFVFILVALYGGEAILAGRVFLQGKLLKPVFTLKTAVLTIFCIVFELIFLLLAFRFFETFFIALLLLLDITTPKIVSLIVLSFQPFAVFGKRRIIQKATEKRARLKNLKVIGITGSYGKTTTKEFLFAMLQKRFRVVKTMEHRNSEIGVSQTILQDLRDDTEVFICEMGAYNKGGIKLLAGIARPGIAILCGANEQHLATFGSMENLLSAEGGKELLEALPENGSAIFNGNNRYCQELYGKTKIPKKILCNTNSAAAEKMLQADVFTESVVVEKEKVSFRVMTKNGDQASFEVQVLGGHNIENILLAVACAKELGMNLSEIAEACTTIAPEMGAMKLRKGIGGLNVIDSTYSANPDGVMATLEYLKTWPEKKVIVMPCLIELGKASKEVHKRIGEKIAEVCDLAIITTKDRFAEIQGGAIMRGMLQDQVVFVEDSKSIVEKIKSVVGPGDVVLLEGRVPQALLPYLS